MPQENENADADGIQAVLSVQDTGCGISKEAMNRIFEPFYTTKGSREGTGLGLSVIQNIVTSMNGRIEVDSEVGKGTRFRIIFPVSMEEDIPRQKAPAVKNIAIVSNDVSFRHSLEKLSGENRQYHFSIFDKPENILSQFADRKDAFDMVIAEYALTPMNGIDLLESIRRMNPQIRLVLLSESSDPDLKWYLNNQIINRIVTRQELEAFLAELKE